MRRIFYVIFCVLIFALCGSCSTFRGTTPTGYADAALVAEQRLELERQQRYIAELERTIRGGADALGSAIEAVGLLKEGTGDLQNWLRRIDTFVRAVIREQQKLDKIQRRNSGENAGAGSRPVSSLPADRPFGTAQFAALDRSRCYGRRDRAISHLALETKEKTDLALAERRLRDEHNREAIRRLVNETMLQTDLMLKGCNKK